MISNIIEGLLLRYQLSVIGNNILKGVSVLEQTNNLFIILIVILTLNLLLKCSIKNYS